MLNYVLTSYIFPLPAPIMLSPTLSISLDNPRGDREIAHLRAYLEHVYDTVESYRMPIERHPEYVSLQLLLDEFRAGMRGREDYVDSFFEQHGGETCIDQLARMWVVARFEDEGQLEYADDQRRRIAADGENGLVMFDDAGPVISNSERLADYTYLLSLLVHSEGTGYMGRGFLCDPNFEPPGPRQDTNPWFNVLLLGVMSRDTRNHALASDGHAWKFFPFARASLAAGAAQLETMLASGRAEKLLYMGNILRIVSDQVRDVKVRIVLLASLIELLLTHAPDTRRFGAEDSISKQFQYKAASVVYLNDRTRDLPSLRARLARIYDARSAIAHGDYKRAFQRTRQLPEGEYPDDMVSDLYAYLRAILEEYIKDPRYVEFLKNG